MDLDHASALALAQRFFNTDQPLKRLGWGIGGYVYLSPTGVSAVKVHRRAEGYERELEVYRRLRMLDITSLHGLDVPKLRGFSSAKRLIQMDVVEKPYLLDFAGVQFHPPDFPPDTMQAWHDGISEFFGPNAHIAYAVYHSLAQHGIYYMDFRPSNMALEGLPGLEPHVTEDEEFEW